MTGGCLAGLGFIIASQATRLVHLYLTMGVLSGKAGHIYLPVSLNPVNSNWPPPLLGLGWGLVFTPMVATVMAHFTRRRTLALGLALSSIGLSSFAFNPLFQLLVEKYTWRGALLILGGISLNIVPCGALIRPQPRSKASENVRNQTLIVRWWKNMSIIQKVNAWLKGILLPLLPSDGSTEPTATCILATSCLLISGAVAALREALCHLHYGHHDPKHWLLCSIFPPGGSQPSGRLLWIPSGFCHVSRWCLRHSWPLGVRLVLGPTSVSADSRAEHVDNAGGGVHHAAPRQHPVWVLLCADDHQSDVRILLRCPDLGGLSCRACHCGRGAHDGGPWAAATHWELRRAAGDSTVRYEHATEAWWQCVQVGHGVRLSKVSWNGP